MQVAVTGGRGFIGGALCRKLIADGHDVACLQREAEPAVPGVTVTLGTLQETAAISSLVEGADVCVHLASSSGPSNSNHDILADLDINLYGGVNLFQKCVEASVKRVIFMSSGGTIYGASEQLPTPETAALHPLTAYSAVKVSLESYLSVYNREFGLERRILRLANPYGPFQAMTKTQGVIPIFMDRIRNGEPIEIWGDGGTIRDFIFIDDVVAAITACLNDEGEHHTFNVGSGRGHSLNEVIEAIEGVSGRKANVLYKPSRQSDVPVSILDCSLVRDELGWSPKFSFAEGLKRTWQDRTLLGGG